MELSGNFTLSGEWSPWNSTVYVHVFFWVLWVSTNYFLKLFSCYCGCVSLVCFQSWS